MPWLGRSGGKGSGSDGGGRETPGDQRRVGAIQLLGKRARDGGDCGRLAFARGDGCAGPEGRSFSPLVIVQYPDHPCSGSRPLQTASWVTVTTSTIEGAGTSLEESAATTTVRGKEMKDVEGTIGMTGKTLLFNFVLRLILLVSLAVLLGQTI